jgi:predicted RNA-binding protein associated with RNAse of E/G family
VDAPAPVAITERKIGADGSVREYHCQLAASRRGLTVIRFDMPQGASVFGAPVDIPPGSVSYGWFWARKPYSLYRMFGPDGALLAHRFDAVASVRLGDDAVEYRDLVLDWWVLPDDTIVEEDRDELDALAAKGVLSPGDVAAANTAAHEVLSRYRHILDEVAALEAKLEIAKR